MIRLAVPGRPVAQGSMRPASAKAGATALRPSNADALARFRADLRVAVELLPEAQRAELPYAQAVAVGYVAWIDRPRNHYRSGAHSYQLKPASPRFPTRAPDVDKIGRAVLDALVSAGVLTDDALVVDLIGWKRYVVTGVPEQTEVLVRRLVTMRH